LAINLTRAERPEFPQFCGSRPQNIPSFAGRFRPSHIPENIGKSVGEKSNFASGRICDLFAHCLFPIAKDTRAPILAWRILTQTMSPFPKMVSITRRSASALRWRLRRHRDECAPAAGETPFHPVWDVACIFAPRSIARAVLLAWPLKRFLMRRRAGHDCFRYKHLGKQRCLVHGVHGGIWCAAANRCLRNSCGYSFNLDGSTLYLGPGSIFVRKRPEFICLGGTSFMVFALMLTSKASLACPARCRSFCCTSSLFIYRPSRSSSASCGRAN